MTLVAFKGKPGSFSHQAARAIYGDSLVPLHCDEFHEIFEAVVSQKAEGLIPIENSLGGSIFENYDLLYDFPVHITKESLLRVEHCLVGLPLVKGESLDQRLQKVTKVYSHPQGLQQTASFFRRYPWIERHASLSTSHAAEYVAQSNSPTLVAVASGEAAQLVGLAALQENIEDDKHNYTRFFNVAPGPAQIIPRKQESQNLKYSIAVCLPHTPGSLLVFLNHLRDINANLTKLESRPLIGQPFHYRFSIDFEASLLSEETLLELKNAATDFKVLGVYAAPTPFNR
jgi:prephenate dehydratase